MFQVWVSALDGGAGFGTLSWICWIVIFVGRIPQTAFDSKRKCTMGPSSLTDVNFQSRLQEQFAITCIVVVKILTAGRLSQAGSDLRPFIVVAIC
jgi:hypothetical protein